MLSEHLTKCLDLFAERHSGWGTGMGIMGQSIQKDELRTNTHTACRQDGSSGECSRDNSATPTKKKSSTAVTLSKVKFEAVH